MTTKRYEAVIFDMDGVIADSEPVYYAAINIVLAPLGKAMGPDLQRRIMGRGITETWLVLAKELDLSEPLDPLIDEYDAKLREMLSEVHETLPGVRELILKLKGRGVRLGLASSSLPGWIDALLSGTGLTGAFDAVASAFMVSHGKPAPDVYLLAAERLSVPPERCVAIEDSPPGIASAKAAGMLAIQVRAASTAFPPLPDADIVLETLKQFDLTLVSGGL